MVGRNLGAAGLVLAMAGGGTGGAAAGGDPLAQHLWTSRVLVLSAPDAADPRLRGQREALASARTDAKARDLVVVEAVGPGAEAETLRRRLDLPARAFRAVLVGKDGGAKLTASEPIAPQRLFATIDAMPMRRDEMRRDEMRRNEMRRDGR
ncbi:DUF4174 domain-containing protein [Methylobacterium planeticum]|uniref:DUF4174 domain-containing protein n=1 Tax=Methylobacterium planeticum TaxID=2615211 RepID=A0A6N6MRI0_9HYPH|nr:DUF4174 domain-containing protein [Methylobacterium planeticum]KAB1073032.1 DUF4174 domain-containing protein [Methylobacterium planeticum]